MAISMQDVMAATAPMVDAFDVNEGRRLGADRAESQANINFDKRVQAEALPITRMLNADGTLDKNAIQGAGSGFTDPHDMWEALNEQMPGNRAIDPVVFQQKYQMGKQLYDMNLMNQIGQMGDSGMSQRKIRNALKENPDLYDYALNNNIIPRKQTSGVTFGDVARTAGMVGAGVGAEKLYRTYGPQSVPELSKMRELRQSGFKVVEKNGRMTIKKMTDMELANRDKLSMYEELKKPKAQRKNVIRKNKTLDKALQGGKGATNKILSKGLNQKSGWLVNALKKAGKFKGGGLAGAGVGIGASLLAEYLMSQQEE